MTHRQTAVLSQNKWYRVVVAAGIVCFAMGIAQMAAIAHLLCNKAETTFERQLLVGLILVIAIGDGVLLAVYRYVAACRRMREY